MLGRSWVLAAALGAVTFFASPDAPLDGPAVAEARVSIAYTLPLLIDGSPVSVVGTAVERQSTWERVDGSRRIVTYTKVRVDRQIYGQRLDEAIWVRHLGGAVGRIGQQVAGEAVLRLHEPTLLFLSPLDGASSKKGRFAVSGAAQGQFLLRSPEAEDDRDDVPAGELEGAALEAFRAQLTSRRLALAPSMGELVRRAGPVVTVQQALKGKTLAEAEALIRETKAARDAQDETSR